MMRFVIMSLGSIGQRHLRNLRTVLPDAEIAVWRRPGPVDRGCPAGADTLLESLEAVLAFAPDAAIVASPASAHLAAAQALADAGIHLLMEKPLATSSVGVADLVRRCRERNLVLMTGYNLRFMPSLREAKRLIAEGAIGTVIGARAEVGQYLPDWRPAADYRQGVSARAELGGGALLELSHDIDYLLWILGRPDRVTARGGRYSDLDIDVEDTAEILLEYEQPRRLVNVHVDMVQRSPIRRCRFIGSEGVLVWDCIADRIECYQSSTGQWQQIDELRLEDRNAMYIDELRDFLDCVRTGRAPECSGEDGQAVLRVVDAARASMSRGVTLAIDAAGG
jgi:predicted dehydrogenase